MSRADASAGGRQARSTHVALGASGYWRESELPLASLLFLLPLIVVYEVGTRFFTSGALAGREEQVIAFTLLSRFFSLFGAHGRHLPALAVIVILLVWHVARRDRWHVSGQTLVGMAVESATWAMPLLLFGVVFSRYFTLAGLVTQSKDDVILVLGAGVYEELVFRLILFTFLSLVLRDAFQFPASWSAFLIVVISGILFSAYHYLSPAEDFRLQTFAFRTLAGIYFGILFLTRGFGITAATHAAYDVLIVLLAAAHSSPG
jgi:membrane protease YdiL (CAAX protease family)